MFVQVIQGQVGDTAQARAVMDRWLVDLQPGAVGWLGGTFGFTDSGVLCALVRFESREAAVVNARRPEQVAWWEQMSRCFTGPVTFHDCSDVQLLVGGGSDDAGFVQLVQGRVTDREAVHTLLDQSSQVLSEHRSDVLGATICIDDDGFFTEVVFFASESAALVEEEMQQLPHAELVDLHEPWFATAEQKRP